MKPERRWQDWANMVFGMLLFFSPWAFGYFETALIATWNAWILGVAVFIVAVSVLYQFKIWEEWVNLVLGAWLILAPFALGFTDTAFAMWTHIALGLLIGGDALWAMLEKSHAAPKTA